MNNRINQLDSVRGLACFSVFMSHLPLLTIGTPSILIVTLKSLGFINGYASDIMFFLLSGFVLSLPFF
jgi:peptidoglycan/LPS O-acetylase OafA/YrhL